MTDKDAQTLQRFFSEEGFVKATLSSPFNKTQPKKIVVNLLKDKQENFLVNTFIDDKVFHKHLSTEKANDYIQENFFQYKQTVIFSKFSMLQILVSKKGKITFIEKKLTEHRVPKDHNRKKNYLIDELGDIIFLQSIDIADQNGKITAKKRDKLTQINRFLEIFTHALSQCSNLPAELNIIDFGCGKAYLSFAICYFLKKNGTKKFKLNGLDLKESVIKKNKLIAHELKLDDVLDFQCKDIADFRESKIDIVIALHACNTASDISLAKAIKAGCKVILCAPCCQNEAYTQIKSDLLKPILKHGILKENFAATATDALRAQLLEAFHYKTDVIEFIDKEHTAKNILIRAIKKNNIASKVDQKALESYRASAGFLNLKPKLYELLQEEI